MTEVLASGSGCECHGKEFVHLHGHTKWSKGDATSTPDELVKKAKASGMTALAVTDHGIASSWVQMAKACKEHGIKFIPGVEMYETNDRTVQSKNEMDSLGYSTHHMVMLPMNNEGLKNLNRIISDASLNGQFYGRNRTDIQTIEQNGWGKGIIATSACLASRTSRLILDGKYNEAKQFALWCSQVFEKFYLELQDNNVKDQYVVNQALIQMAQETGLELVYTQDYHYVEDTEQDLHDTWICIGRGQEKADASRQGYDGGPYHLATPDEMWDSVKNGRIPEEAYHNTVKIADMCNVEFDFKKNRFPKYKYVPQGYTADSWLRHISFQALWDYIVERSEEQGDHINAQEYTDRLNYELQVIADKGYSDYFLILEDIFGFCRRAEIYTGPGRGSGAGSMVAFLNNITGLDPIKHKLLFERFLNPERASAPDIDFDIQHDRREEVFQYIIDRFGKDHTAQIVTYGTEKLRSGVDDLCRVMKEYDQDGNIIKYGQDVSDTIKKTIPGKFPDQTEPTYGKMKELAENPEKYREKFRDQTDKMHEMAKQFMAYMAQFPEIDRGLKFVEGLIRNYGIHAAAVVITDEPITDHIPVYKSSGLMPVTAFSMKEVDEDLHMLKIDALSLKTLTVVEQAVSNIHKMTGKPFDIRKIPEQDQDAIRTVREGNTVGVFQVSGGPITQYTKQVKPTEFDNITDVLALFRPGPLEALVKEGGLTMAEQYIENYDEYEFDKFMADIPQNLQPIYEDTRGILIYQEQIMALAQAMAGYTLGGADVLRRAIGKKDDALLASLKAEFVYGTEKGIPMLEAEIAKLESVTDDTRDEDAIKTYSKQLKSMKEALAGGKSVQGCVNRGYEEEYSITTFNAIRRFSGYSFNRSHSAAYAMIAYWTAYLKAHHPVEFMTGLLTVEADTADDTIRNIQECRRLDIEILPPDINKSELGYSIEFTPDESGNPKKAIRFGLLSIKGVGNSVIEEIMRRPAHPNDPDSEGTPYKSFDDFFYRVDKRKINKSYIEKLIKAGCFDFDVSNRYQMLNHFYFNLRGDKNFLGTYDAYLKAKTKADTSFQFSPKDYNEDVVCEMEQELFGFYLTHHPYADLPYINWDDLRDREPAEIGGKIVKIKKIKTKKKDDMCFLELETAGGKIDITVFPKQFEEFKPEFFKGNIAIFCGSKQLQPGDKSSLLLDKIKKVRKKKFMVEKPPELAELAEQRKQAGGRKQLTLDDLGGPTVKGDPYGAVEDGIAEDEFHNRADKDELSDLASLFES